MKIIIRTDASIPIGTGHVIRCLTLADALRQKGAMVAFIARELPGNLCDYMEGKEYIVYRLPYSSEKDEKLSQGFQSHAHWLGTSWETDADETREILERFESSVDWLIVDHYKLDERWETLLRTQTGKIMVIDDLADRSHNCDLLLDQNFFPDGEDRYKKLVPPQCRKLLGPRYALLRREFIEAKNAQSPRSGIVKRILVFFGGADTTNETEKALKALQMLNRSDILLDVVVGASNPARERIRGLCTSVPNAHYHCQVTNMSELMRLADLAVGAGGTSTWERCCVGLPSLTIAVAENQSRVSENLAEAGHIIYGGWHADVTVGQLSSDVSFLIRHPDVLRRLSQQTGSLVDGAGTDRVLRHLFENDEMVGLRLAGQEDCRRIFEWRNHPEVRRHCHDMSPLQWEAHQRWFEQAIRSPNMILLIAELASNPVGVLWYDFTDNCAMVSVYLRHGNEGSGIGSTILRSGSDLIKRSRPEIKKLVAEIKPDNAISMKAFEKAGFRERNVTYVLDL